MDKMKICNECKEAKPATLEFFGKRTNIKCGLDGRCKVCIAKKYKKYRIKNKDKIEKKKQEWRENNKEHIRRQAREWQENNKEHLKRYREKNKEKIRKICREWERQDRKENPAKYSHKKTLRRTRQKGLKATLTLKQWVQIKKDFHYKCAYCGMDEETHIKENNQQLHKEHLVPLTNQGVLTHNNIIPACRSCNSSKGNKDFSKWYPEYKYYDKNKEKFILNYLGYINDSSQQLSML